MRGDVFVEQAVIGVTRFNNLAALTTRQCGSLCAQIELTFSRSAVALQAMPDEDGFDLLMKECFGSWSIIGRK